MHTLFRFLISFHEIPPTVLSRLLLLTPLIFLLFFNLRKTKRISLSPTVRNQRAIGGNAARCAMRARPTVTDVRGTRQSKY